jgi:hypothetical protein
MLSGRCISILLQQSMDLYGVGVIGYCWMLRPFGTTPVKERIEDRRRNHLQSENIECPRRGLHPPYLPYASSGACHSLAGDSRGILCNRCQFDRNETESLGCIHRTTMYVLEL